MTQAKGGRQDTAQTAPLQSAAQAVSEEEGQAAGGVLMPRSSWDMVSWGRDRVPLGGETEPRGSEGVPSRARYAQPPACFA